MQRGVFACFEKCLSCIVKFVTYLFTTWRQANKKDVRIIPTERICFPYILWKVYGFVRSQAALAFFRSFLPIVDIFPVLGRHVFGGCRLTFCFYLFKKLFKVLFQHSYMKNVCFLNGIFFFFIPICYIFRNKDEKKRGKISFNTKNNC